jgi:GT2 family glycosyltransferase
MSLYEALAKVALRGPQAAVPRLGLVSPKEPSARWLSPAGDLSVDELLRGASSAAERKRAALEMDTERAATKPALAEGVLNWLSKVDWDEQRASLGSRRADLTSIIIPTFEDWSMTRRAVLSVLETTSHLDVEVIVVDNGSRFHVSRILNAVFHGVPNVLIHTNPINLNFAGGINCGFGLSSGRVVVLLNNDTMVQPGWLEPMVAAIQGDDVVGVQPLLVYPSGTIQCAGVAFGPHNTLPYHFLAGHPQEDVERIGSAAFKQFSAITAACVMIRAADFAAVSGLDEGFANGQEDIDLCLRLREELPDKYFEVVPDSQVIHLEGESESRIVARYVNRERFWRRWAGRIPDRDDWRYRGIGVLGVSFLPLDVEDGELGMSRGTAYFLNRARSTRDGHVILLRAAVRLVQDERPAVQDTLREAVAAIARRAEEGDVQLAVDSLESRYRPSRYLDDVVFHFSVDTLLNPQPGAVNIGVELSDRQFTEQERATLDGVLPVADVVDPSGLPSFWAGLRDD